MSEKKPYIVFMGRRGHNTIIWRPEENPLGVWEGESGEYACQQAAAQCGVMGAFFAIEGTFWGVTPANAPRQFGERAPIEERLEALLGEATKRGIMPVSDEGEGEADPDDE